MKKILMSLILMPLVVLADTEIVDDVTWTYTVSDGKAEVMKAAAATDAITIPSLLGGCTVTRIGRSAFSDCSSLTSVMIPAGVTSIYGEEFSGCSSLTSIIVSNANTEYCSVDGVLYDKARRVLWRVPEGRGGGFVIPQDVMSVGDYAFIGCKNLQSVTFPSGVTGGYFSFSNCAALHTCVFESDEFVIRRDMFVECPSLEKVVFKASRLSVYNSNAIGPVFKSCCRLKEVFFGSLPPDYLSYLDVLMWADAIKYPEKYADDWERVLGNLNYGGEWVSYQGEYPNCKEKVVKAKATIGTIGISVTNVVVNYILNSVHPEFAIPATSDIGFVNIVTEVKGGAVAVPASWADNYPSFTTKFGADFTKALSMKTGKKDGAGSDMFVWQDYVAGTDPTKEDDVFKASITIVEGRVAISYSPALDDERRAMRKYTTLGKKSLLDTDWTVVQEGQEAEYNFFKISVEMK